MNRPDPQMTDHVSAPSVTIGTHRLWISLWTRLGQYEDNTGQTGGNQQASGGESGAVHSSPPAGPFPHTGPVATKSRAGLGDGRLSPGSTVPTTATNLFITTSQFKW